MSITNQQLEKMLDERYKFSSEPFSIDIAYIIDFGMRPEHCRISLTNPEINKKIFETYFKDKRDQIPVGFRICNVGDTIIKDIVVPNYKYNSKTCLYEGSEELIDLPQNGVLDLPTRYLIFLLMSHGQSLKVNNGNFQILADYLEGIDDLSNFKFIPNSEWSQYFNSLKSHISIYGDKVSRDDIYLGYDIIPEPIEYRQRFGYLMNPEAKFLQPISKDEQLVKDIEYENIDNSIKFLATVLWKKDFK